MFRTDLLSIIRSLNTVFTAIGICHTGYVDCLLARSGWNILTSLAANKMHYFSTLFGKELYMFRTDLLSIIRSLIAVFTAIGICHTGYDDCLLARSE
jgi:hypothetical protein